MKFNKLCQISEMSNLCQIVICWISVVVGGARARISAGIRWISAGILDFRRNPPELGPSRALALWPDVRILVCGIRGP